MFTSECYESRTDNWVMFSSSNCSYPVCFTDLENSILILLSLETSVTDLPSCNCCGMVCSFVHISLVLDICEVGCVLNVPCDSRELIGHTFQYISALR